MSGTHDMLCELSLIMSEKAGGSGLSYIIEIVDNLEKVMAGELEEFEFGYDATIIDFRKEISIINYNYFEDQLEVSSGDIYNLMKEWKEHIIPQLPPNCRQFATGGSRQFSFAELLTVGCNWWGDGPD